MDQSLSPHHRVGTQDREAAVRRLETAFLEGRLTDVELSDRIDRALGARLGADLEGLLADLPAVVEAPHPAAGAPAEAPPTLGWIIHHKGRRLVGPGGRPGVFQALAYKSDQTLDLSRAQVTRSLTELRVRAYKSTVEVIVPPGWRVEVSALTYKGRIEQDEEGTGPVLRLVGWVYKGTIRIVRR